ncbi:hypothetical protein [Hyphomonas sp.]|uniref:hypothetical protein n=1 Tax=Hyphomonas sp. TaxID=87 RepID=UPI0030F728B3
MKRIMIIPATAALLTGLSATAQDFNDNADAVKTPAPVLYTEETPELDELTIDELNALQLQRLQVASTETVETGDTMVQVETDMETMPSDTMESETAASVEADTEMNAHDHMSDDEMMPATDMPDMTTEQDDPVMEDEMEPDWPEQ